MKHKLGPISSLLVLLCTLIPVGCNSSSGAPPPPPPNITVSISSAVVQVPAGGTVTLTASASGDPAGKGVTWSLIPASGAGSLSNITSSSATYNAPATPPVSDLSVTVVATAVSDPSKSTTLILDVPAISVSLTASVDQVGAGGTSVLTAAVTNDPSNKGVSANSWTITPATGAGTLSNPSGTSVTYTAPATPPPSDTQVVISANSASDSTKTGSATITFAAIAVSLSASPFSVEATGTSQITATVNFDPANAGVNPASWAITSPATGGGTLSSPTSTSVSYTAPSTAPVANLPVTITATSVSDATKSGSTTVTVLAITLSISPASALIPLNITQALTPTLANDPANAGVSWTITQNGTACPGCGTVAPTSTLSGTPTTYTAPAALPSPARVTVTATSVTDTTKTQSATLTVTNGTVKIVPAALSFGTIKTTQSASRTIALTNTDTSALAINSTTFSGTTPAAFSLTGNTCGSSVTAGASCTLTVTFKPMVVGAYSAILDIADSSTDSPQQVLLAGAGRITRALPGPAVATNKAPGAPLPTGPNPVGTQVMELVDPARTDPFLNNGTVRDLMVRLWYPAATGQSCRRAEYASPRVWSDFSRLVGVPLPHVTTNSCWNAIPTTGAHPVVLFTHGYTGTFTDYTFLFEELASRGYVVASVDHTFEATAVEFPDGRLVESAFGSYLGTSMRADELAMDFAVSVRLNDLKFVLNALESLNEGDASILAGKLDMSRVALAGHSLGGLTAILAIEQDSRFRAGVILDGVVPKSAFNGTNTPVLMLAAGRDTWSAEETQMWRGLHGSRVAINLRGAEHVTPSDMIWLAPGAIQTGTLGPEKTVAAVRRYVTAFLDANLLGKAIDPLLTGPSGEYPDAVVTTRTEPLRAKY